MRLRRVAVSACVAALVVAAGGCDILKLINSTGLYSRCEIPLDDMACPVVDLAALVPEAERDGDPDRWGCDLWLRVPVDSAEEDRTTDRLVPAEEWRIYEAGEGSRCEGGAGQEVYIAANYMAAFRDAVLTCPTEEGHRSCDPLDAPHRNVCERIGAPADFDDAGSAVSAIVQTTRGPAVVWFRGSWDVATPMVTWLEVDGDGVTPTGSVEPCSAQCDGPDMTSSWTSGYTPPQQVATSGEAVVTVGLCGDDQLRTVRPDDPTCSPAPLAPDAGDDDWGLSIAPARAESKQLVLWQDGRDLRVSHRPDAGGDLVGNEVSWFPTSPTSGAGTAAACFTSFVGGQCVIAWQDAWPEGEIQLATLRMSDGADLGGTATLGSGGMPQIGYSRDEAEDTTWGVAAWRTSQLGIVARGWQTYRAGFTGFGPGAVQLGAGWMDPSGQWGVSLPRIVEVDVATFLVGWWRTLPPRESSQSSSLELKIVEVSTDDSGNVVLDLSDVELVGADPIETTHDTDVTYFGELGLGPVEPPALAWTPGGGGLGATLTVAWREASALFVQTFATVLPLNEDPVRFLASPRKELTRGVSGALCPGDAVTVGDRVVAAFNTDGGLFAALVDRTGETIDRTVVDVTGNLLPTSLSLATKVGNRTDVYAVFGAAKVVREDYWLDLGDLEIGFGGASLPVTADGFGELEVGGLWPVKDEAGSDVVSPRFAASEEPILAWSLIDSTAVPDDPYSPAEVVSFVPRLSRVVAGSGQLDLAGWYDDSQEIEVSTGTRPLAQAALAVEARCPDSEELSSEQRCAYVAFSAADVYMDSFVLGVGNASSTGERSNGVVAGPVEQVSADLPATVLLDERAWVIPTGIEVVGSRLLSVGTELDAVGYELGTVRVVSYDASDWSVSGSAVETLWLDLVDRDENEQWQTVALRLSAPNEAEAVGAVWTRHSLTVAAVDRTVGNDHDGDAADADGIGTGSGREDQTEVELYFAELDAELRPASRAVRIDGWTGVASNPLIGEYEWVQDEPIPRDVPDASAYAQVPAHFSSVVTGLGGGTYLVIWVRNRHVIDPEGLSSTLQGTVRAQLVSCH